MQFNPQQIAFIEYFFNPESETFSNMTQSGIKAGFDEKYSENLSSMGLKWFEIAMGIYGDDSFLKDIDDELKKIAKMETISHVKVGDEVVIKQDPALLKIKQDTLKFLAERLNKNKYSTKQEIDLNAKGNIIISFEDSFSGRE
jgi:hypothetical protein